MSRSIFSLAAVALLFSGGVHAATIDTVDPYDPNDTYIAQSSAVITTSQLEGVLRANTTDSNSTLSTAGPATFSQMTNL